MRRRITMIAAGTVAAVALVGGTAVAAANRPDGNRDGMLSIGTADRVGTAASGGSTSFATLAVTEQTDDAYCNHGGAQCVGSGVPAQGNGQRVRLVVQVLNGGSPVSGLTASSFALISNLVPPGGAAVVLNTGCASCFGAVGNGMYALFAQPFGSNTWLTGAYPFQLQVTVPTTSSKTIYRVLARIDVS